MIKKIAETWKSCVQLLVCGVPANFFFWRPLYPFPFQLASVPVSQLFFCLICLVPRKCSSEHSHACPPFPSYPGTYLGSCERAKAALLLCSIPLSYYFLAEVIGTQMFCNPNVANVFLLWNIAYLVQLASKSLKIMENAQYRYSQWRRWLLNY